jgi:hypothetical protein
MKLRAEGLDLDLQCVRAADDEGWCRILALVTVPGFTGKYEAWLQTVDLKRFCEEVTVLHKKVGQVSQARLCSAEPDIDIKLVMDLRGHIQGEYAFESERRDGIPTVLTGRFDMDQSYLPGLLKTTKNLLAELQVLGKR